MKGYKIKVESLNRKTRELEQENDDMKRERVAKATANRPGGS